VSSYALSTPLLADLGPKRPAAQTLCFALTSDAITRSSAATLSRRNLNAPADAPEAAASRQRLAKDAFPKDRYQFLMLRCNHRFFDAAMQPLPKFNLVKENRRKKNMFLQ
jgi:hypothetical protein